MLLTAFVSEPDFAFYLNRGCYLLWNAHSYRDRTRWAWPTCVGSVIVCVCVPPNSTTAIHFISIIYSDVGSAGIICMYDYVTLSLRYPVCASLAVTISLGSVWKGSESGVGEGREDCVPRAFNDTLVMRRSFLLWRWI